MCAYAEVLGFHTAGQDLGNSQAPMRLLARVAGVPVLGLLIDIGALISLFAGTLDVHYRGSPSAAANVA